MSNVPVTTKYNEDSDTSLQFLYDVQSRQVLYATQSPELFFETSLDFANASPFQQIAQADDLVNLQQRWNDCLVLKDREKSFFNVAAASPNLSFSNYQFNITGMNSFGATTGNLLLCSVQKTVDTGCEGTPDEAYRKECAEFIDIAAHELDAPVRKALLLLDRLGSKAGTDLTSSDYFLRLQSCLGDMRHLVTALTHLSRCSSERIDRVSCNTALIVEEVVKDIPELQGEGVLSASQLPVVSGDSNQLQVLFRNLLENAVRFGPRDGSLRVTITTELIDPGEERARIPASVKRYYKFTVADNGIGFDPQYASQIFKPLIRLHGKNDYPGNGIGLAICQRVVENHHGIIYGESEEGHGARFIFILPESLN